MSFEFFDPAGEVRITIGNLPHWYQPGVTYFVTFRTEDSLPREVARLWYRRRDDWLQRHGINPRAAKRSALIRRLPADQRREFDREFSREFLAYLDRGCGACRLKQPTLARIVADSLRYFDRERYRLGDFVVMPNHVHLLVCLLGQTDVERQCYSWKKYTGMKINRALGQRGRFWHEESFDHLVLRRRARRGIQPDPTQRHGAEPLDQVGGGPGADGGLHSLGHWFPPENGTQLRWAQRSHCLYHGFGKQGDLGRLGRIAPQGARVAGTVRWPGGTRTPVPASKSLSQNPWPRWLVVGRRHRPKVGGPQPQRLRGLAALDPGHPTCSLGFWDKL